jgi:hypothetical protein
MLNPFAKIQRCRELQTRNIGILKAGDDPVSERAQATESHSKKFVKLN